MTMNPDRCPSGEQLCELFDGEAGDRATRLRHHVRNCPRCEATMIAFGRVRRQLLPLGQSALDPGIAQAVLLRLPREARKPRRARRRWARAADVPQLGVRVLGGVVALAAGAVLGLSIVAGGAVADRTGMSVFAGEPAGRLCAGLPACGR